MDLRSLTDILDMVISFESIGFPATAAKAAEVR